MGHEDFPKRELSHPRRWRRRPADIARSSTSWVQAASWRRTGCPKPRPTWLHERLARSEALRVQGLAKPHEGVQLRISPKARSGARLERDAGYYNNPEANAKAFTADGWFAHPAIWASLPAREALPWSERLKTLPRRRRQRRPRRGRGSAARASRRAARAGDRRARSPPRRSAGGDT